jgi:type I restriction enzyme, R subunit
MFTESNTVEQMILDALSPRTGGHGGAKLLRDDPPGWGYSLGGELRPAWEYVPALEVPRKPGDVMVESWVRLALIRLNPEIAAQPDRADEVIYKLRAILLSVQNDGLVRANEALPDGCKGEKTMPFGPGGEHVAVRLIDFENPGEQRAGGHQPMDVPGGPAREAVRRGAVVNGLPMVIGEAKTPVRPRSPGSTGPPRSTTIYERACRRCSCRTSFQLRHRRQAFRYGSVRMPIDIWGPWRTQENEPERRFADVRKSVESMLRPEVVLDILQNFTVFATDKKHRRIKIICRYQQYEGTNQIVQRVVKGRSPKKG